ncbi:MAG: hypothetical protein ABN482_15480 [Corticimicrobacter sp.]|uniref:hypothetical protein n=1 Tax=Corticimicrobacter sp. TaxID=2678536 RepID=UPI0032DB9F24
MTALLSRSAKSLLLASSLFLGLSSAAQAQTALECGVYKSPDTSYQIRVLSSNLIQKTGLGSPELLYYAIEGDKLSYFNIDLDGGDTYKLPADGKSIDVGFDFVYSLQEAAPCAAPTQFPETKVWPLCWKSDLMTCLEAYGATSLQELESMCNSGMAFACKRLPDAYREAAGIESSLFGKSDPLPDAAIASLRNACLNGISASVCNTVAAEAWNAGRYLDVREIVQHTCNAPIGDSDACAIAASLSKLTPELLAQPAPASLPQGTFTAPVGAVRELIFGADGIVKDGDGFITMQARQEDGLIRMQHNKGGDFEFKPLGDQYLLGLDYWNQLALFSRTGD